MVEETVEKKLTDEKAMFNYIANTILGEVKPLYLRKRIVNEILDIIHRLQDEIKGYKGIEKRAGELLDENLKFKQVYAEQKAEIERLNKCVMSEVQVRKCCEDIIQDTIKQTVNDMGKEIYKRVTDNLKMWLRERYDVEVG